MSTYDLDRSEDHGAAPTAEQRIAEELHELESLAAALLTARNTLRDKAKSLYTSAQVSEAELVAAPLRQRIAELESQLSVQRLDRMGEAVPAECVSAGKLIRQLDVALSQVSALQNRKDELHGRVANLVEWLDLRNGELASANEQRDQARAEAERLEALLASRDTALAELRALVAGHQRDLDTMADTLKGREKQIQDGRAAQEVTRQELDGKIRQIATLTREHEGAMHRVHYLEGLLGEISGIASRVKFTVSGSDEKEALNLIKAVVSRWVGPSTPAGKDKRKGSPGPPDHGLRTE